MSTSNNVVDVVVSFLWTPGPRNAVEPGALCGRRMRMWRSSSCRRRLCRASPLPSLPRGGHAQFLEVVSCGHASPCSQPPLCSCSPALCRAFSYSWLSCCDCWVSAPSGCCKLEVEDFVKVNDPTVVLFDVLAVLDASGSLLTSSCQSWMKTWIFQESVLKQEPQVSQVPQVEPQEVQLPQREVFPECWERDRVTWPVFLPR